MFENLSGAQQFGLGIIAALAIGFVFTVFVSFLKYGPEGAKFTAALIIFCAVAAIALAEIGEAYFPEHWFIKGSNNLVDIAIQFIENY